MLRRLAADSITKVGQLGHALTGAAGVKARRRETLNSWRSDSEIGLFEAPESRHFSSAGRAWSKTLRSNTRPRSGGRRVAD